VLVAEMFYKFYSFALECAAFPATWYVLDAVARWLMPKPKQSNEPRAMRWKERALRADDPWHPFRALGTTIVRRH
jgi:hypothetical protein